MSPTERVLYERIRRRAEALQPGAQRRLLVAFDIIRGSLSEAEFLRASSNNQIERLLDELLSDKALDPAFASLRALIDRDALNASANWSRDIPRGLGGVFDALNPRVITAVRELDTRVLQGLKDQVRETVRQAAQAGLEAGKHPRAVARGMREALGLAPNQEEAVRNFRRMLEAGDREALTRELRDHRFDTTLRKALGKNGTGLTAPQIDRMADAYRRRMIAFNAETHARTIALDTQRLAQRASWESAIAQGTVDRGRIRRIWIAVGGPGGDGRNRPEHLELHGTAVGFDERYPNGQLIPGESDFNCRCLERIVLLPATTLPLPFAA